MPPKKPDDDDAGRRRSDFQQRLATAAAVTDQKQFGSKIRLYETCLFIDGVASPADYMSTVFRNCCGFDNSTINIGSQSFDEYLPFDLWSIVAAFVAPTRPADGVSTNDKAGLHGRIANQLLRTTVKEGHPKTAVGKLWLFQQTLHHLSAIIDLDKTVRRSQRAGLHMRNRNYQAALVDYNYDLFHRQPPLASADTELLYRFRSDALFGLDDVNGAIDSRSNAVRVSADLASVAADFAQIDRWRELLAKPTPL